MKKAIVGFILILGAVLPWACSQSSYVPPTTPPVFTATPSSPTATFTITNTLTVTLTPTITNTPTVTSTSTVTLTPTVTNTPAVTITVSIISGAVNTDNPFGYYYTASGFTNDPTTSTLNVTAHVGDTIVLPSVSGLHPLYFDNSSTTCLFNGGTNAASSFTYTFPATGLYYFHCGFHAANCSLGLTSCGSTNCTGLSGVITVS
jgi:plastocyanin